MGVDIPNVGVDIPEVSQIAFVVADLDAAMERYRTVLGVDPWEVYRIGPPEQTEGSYYGESANPSFNIGYAYRGDLEIEIIEPVDGQSVHQDFLNRDEEGIHHIACFDFEDPYEVADAFEDAGLPIVQSGHWHDTHYMYFDTTAVLDGLYFETLAGGGIDPGPEYVFPNN